MCTWDLLWSGDIRDPATVFAELVCVVAVCGRFPFTGVFWFWVNCVHVVAISRESTGFLRSTSESFTCVFWKKDYLPGCPRSFITVGYLSVSGRDAVKASVLT